MACSSIKQYLYTMDTGKKNKNINTPGGRANVFTPEKKIIETHTWMYIY
jgi:hypothetical protein